VSVKRLRYRLAIWLLGYEPVRPRNIVIKPIVTTTVSVSDRVIARWDNTWGPQAR
jgi:hypothetical protein